MLRGFCSVFLLSLHFDGEPRGTFWNEEEENNDIDRRQHRGETETWRAWNTCVYKGKKVSEMR